MTLILTLLFFVMTLETDAPKAGKVEVLVVGVFHFDSPGLDMFNTRVKDVLAERRQKEILEVVKRLEGFRPTKVAVEAPYGSTSVQNRFDKFLQDKITLGPSEIDQVAFRIARNLGHTRLYGVDFKQDMDMDSVFRFAKENGQDELLQRTIQAFGEKIQPLINEQHLESMSIMKILHDMNVPEFDKAGHGMYMTMLRIGRDSKYPGTDMVAGWYARNLRIATNLMRIADTADDRVLLLIGSGHAPLIRQFLEQTPGFEVRDAQPFLKP